MASETRASEKGPSSGGKKANKVRIKENKQLQGRYRIRFLILKFLYFSFDFLWELWRHVSQTDSMLEEEQKGGGGRRSRGTHGGGGKAQAKGNELEQRCFGNNCQLRWVWSKVYWCCVGKKSLRKARTRQSIPTRATNKTHSKQCHGVAVLLQPVK